MPGRLLYCPRRCFKFVKLSSPAPCRTYTTKILKGDDLGPIQEDEHQSFRIRKDGEKLPLPPILDTVVSSKRSHWSQTKKKPDVKTFTPFQKKLWENPYAHALASPPRICRSTSTLQPSDLLILLHPRPHPTTKDPWLLPVSLATSAKNLSPTYRFLAHKYVASHLTKNKNWKKGIHLRVVEKLGRKKAEGIVWREDMPELVLELLRKRALNKLRWHFTQPGRLTTCANPIGGDFDGIEDVSCVLYLESLKTHADDLHVESAAIVADIEKWSSYFIKGFPKLVDPHEKEGVTHRSPVWYTEPLIPRLQTRSRFPPLEFKKTKWQGKKVAVYSLHDLLGEDKTRELVQGSQYKGETCVVMKRGRHNVPVELLLMQLQSYLAEPGP